MKILFQLLVGTATLFSGCLASHQGKCIPNLYTDCFQRASKMRCELRQLSNQFNGLSADGCNTSLLCFAKISRSLVSVARIRSTNKLHLVSPKNVAQLSRNKRRPMHKESVTWLVLPCHHSKRSWHIKQMLLLALPPLHPLLLPLSQLTTTALR
jgi:hypothetical protein